MTVTDERRQTNRRTDHSK